MPGRIQASDQLLPLPHIRFVRVGRADERGVDWRYARNLAAASHFDLPNERSSHTVPTPRGGGWGVMLALLPFWIWAVWRAGRLHQPVELVLLGAAMLLMAISWVDDRRGLGPIPRFAAQLLAVGAVMILLPHDLSITSGLLPLPLDRLFAALLWLWFVNLFNFMDGIDGLAGGSAAAMGLGLMLVSLRHGPSQLEAFRGAMIIAVAIGFLIWNWHPAKIFLGDIGSVPIGFLLGFCLLRLAMDGGQIPALIIPLYYLADATITRGAASVYGRRIANIIINVPPSMAGPMPTPPRPRSWYSWRSPYSPGCRYYGAGGC
jgi:UDP-N-acetylmuramyl pentapeptide phosphotransferase/UDP-N-acetylglucosamine-1-phosphate transferase